MGRTHVVACAALHMNGWGGNGVEIAVGAKDGREGKIKSREEKSHVS